jgi:thioredoxin-like negative regulator of GroEL
MNNTEPCILLQNEEDLERAIHTNESFFVLFYADWCYFSQRFLPIYEKCSTEATHPCYRMIMDEHPALCLKYSVEVYPTVIFFEKGNVVKRLDGIRDVGLNEKQYRDLINACKSPK